MREVTVAVAQLAPELAKVGDNLKRMVEIIDDICRAQKVDLIVFPELITTGYECGVRFTDLAERVPGPATNIIAEQARDYDTYIAFGLVEKHRVESTLYDAAVLVDHEGELAYTYRKVHLNAIFVAAANRLGEEYTISFFGDSLVMGPRGETYASFEEPGEEGFRVAKVDLDEVKRYREELQLLQCRQPQAYRDIVKMY